MTVHESAGLAALVQSRQGQWQAWEEQIEEVSDAIAGAICHRVMGMISDYFDNQCQSAVFLLPNAANRQSVSVICSFRSPVSSIFWQSVPPGDSSEPSVLMTIRESIPGKVEKEVKSKAVMDEVQPHEIKPKVDYNRIDQLLVGIATKATEQLKEALQEYAAQEGNSIFKFDARLSTGSSSSSSFVGKSVLSHGEPTVSVSFWIDEAKAADVSDDNPPSSSIGIPGSGLFSFLRSSKSQ